MDQVMTQMCSKSVQNNAQAFGRQFSSAQRHDAADTAAFRRLANLQWKEGKPIIMGIINSEKTRLRYADFNPLVDIAKKSWRSHKKKTAAIALLRSCVRVVSNRGICATVHVKAGEQNPMAVPLKDVNEKTGETDDVNARARFVNPNYGDKHHVWINGLIQELFMEMFPYSYIKGMTPSQLVNNTQEAKDIIIGNAAPGESTFSGTADFSAFDSNQTEQNTDAVIGQFLRMYEKPLLDLLCSIEWF
jgi:hypothetical protein